MPEQQPDEAKRAAGLSIEEAVSRLQKAKQNAAKPEQATRPAPTAEQEPNGLDPDETNLEPGESDAGGSVDAAAEAAAGDGEDEDLDAKDPVFVATISGEEVEVPLSELIASYQRHGDYTKKTQALAEQRRAVEQKANEVQTLHATLTAEQQRIAKEREQYDAALQALGNVLTDADKEFSNVNWEELWENDPAEAGKLQHRLRQHEKRKADLAEEQRRREEERKREYEQQQTAAMNQFKAAMSQHFPEWADEGVRSKDWSAMYKVARDLDFTDDEIRTTLDPRIFRLLHKAMKFDRIAATKQSAANPARVPAREPAKVVQPGGARPAIRAGASGSRDAWANFAKRPGIDSAVAFLRAKSQGATRK